MGAANKGEALNIYQITYEHPVLDRGKARLLLRLSKQVVLQPLTG